MEDAGIIQQELCVSMCFMFFIFFLTFTIVARRGTIVRQKFDKKYTANNWPQNNPQDSEILAEIQPWHTLKKKNLKMCHSKCAAP